MKKHIIILAALALAFGGIFSQLTAATANVTITPDVIAAKFAERDALSSTAATKNWTTQNAAFFAEAVKQIASLPDDNAKRLAYYYLITANAGKKTWDTGASIAQQYQPNTWLSHFANAQQIAAATPTKSNFNAIVSGAKRTGQPAVANAAYEAVVGQGILRKDFQKWFLKRIGTVNDVTAATLLRNEIKAVYALPPSEAKTAWLNELTTIRQAESILKQ